MAEINRENTQLGGQLISSQIVERLLTELRTGCYANAARLPAEVELAAGFQVSRTVIRDALSELEREGLIERVRGVGTVINRGVVDLNNRLDQKFEYYAMIRSMGCEPSADMVQVRHLAASPELAADLKLEPSAPVLMIRKRVKADDRPVIASVDYVPLELLRGLDLEQTDFSRPVFDILEECGVHTVSTVAHVKAVYGTALPRQMLELEPSQVLLLLDEVSSTRLCQPVLRSLSYYTDFFDFSILRKKF